MSTLKEATRTAHVSAERTRFARALLGKEELTVGGWRRHLTNLLPCYAAVEARVPALAGLGLIRSTLIRADLDAMGGPAEEGLLPATLVYLDVVAGLSDEQVLAHVYVRWLGDLHGGQMIARRLAPVFACSHLRFEDRDAALAALRQLLAGKDEVLADEANRCFALIQRLYEDLAP